MNKKHFSITISIIIFLFLIYKPILEPSYASVALACFPNQNLITGYETAGTTTYFPSNNTYKVEVPHPNNILLKHEHIHVIQIKQHRFFSCRVLPLKYLTEIEAYTFQNLPDKYYVKIYGNYNLN